MDAGRSASQVGYASAEAASLAEGPAAFDAEQSSVILLDINLPDGNGLDGLREIKRRQPSPSSSMITADVMVEDTIEALRGGSYDFIAKPIKLDELLVTIRNGIEASRLRKEVIQIRKERAREFSFDQIVGRL